MGLLNKLTIKNLKLNKKRTIVTIIGIMLSVALITAVSTMYFSLNKTLINFEIKEKGDFHLAFFDVSKDGVEELKNNRNIKDIFVVSNVGYASIPSKNKYKPYAYVKALTTSSLENLSVQLIDGRLPSNSFEILIPSHLKTNGRYELNIGDEITLNLGKRLYENEIIDYLPYTEGETLKAISSKTYKVVGIIERPASNIESYEAAGYSFITYLDDKNITGDVDVYLKLTKNGSKNYIKEMTSILGVDYDTVNTYYNNAYLTEKEEMAFFNEISKAKYQYDVNGYLISLENDPLGKDIVPGLDKVIYVVCIIIVVTSVFCIKNSFDISITEKTKQYGMLRSVGATKKQIRKNVFYEATILGLFGIPLGLLLGFIASYILIIVSNFLLNKIAEEIIVLVLDFSIYAVIFAIILGIITIYFSAIRSAFKASRVSPIENIRNSGGIKIKSKKLRVPKLISKLFGIGGEISYKNLKRNKKKYRTTVVSIIVSVSIFIALSYFMSLAFSTIDREITISDYNLSIDFNYKDFSKNKINEITLIDGIKDYSIVRNGIYDHENLKYRKEVNKYGFDDSYKEGINVISIGDYQFKKYVEKLGLKYESVKNKGILIDYIDLHSSSDEYKGRLYENNIGDVITLMYDKKINVEIAYVTKELPFGISENQYLVIPDHLYDELDSNSYINIYIDSNDATKTLNEIEKIMGDIEYSSYNLDESVRMMKNLYLLIGIFLYGFIIVISLIGVTNIFNTITTNMELRKSEFAMLKSIGMTSDEFNRMIRLESIFMGSKSLLFGLPIGIILSYLIYNALGKDMDATFKLPYMAIIISILVVFLLITCIMKYSIGKIKKQNTIETIRNENI